MVIILILLDFGEIDIRLDGIIKQLQNSRSMPQSPSMTVNDFKTIFQYLAFVACAAKAPIRQKMLNESLQRIEKAGDAENIQRWCFWTPNQLRCEQ